MKGVGVVIGAEYWGRGGKWVCWVVPIVVAASALDSCATCSCMAHIWSFMVLLESEMVWKDTELAVCAAAKFSMNALKVLLSASYVALPPYPISPAVLMTLL